ncbi:MAG: oxidoreductase [Planctomycetaceae bacterium]|nr:oxidoreductase [Planctomycetaceae bacterium]
MSQEPKASRRSFLKSTLPAAISVTIVPRHVLGGPGQTPPSEQVNVAGIGAGGMGGHNIRAVSQHGANIVALCDVDDERGRRNFELFPKARRYRDFRVMLEKESKHIDAVTVGTPDHVHAVASMAAIHDGKHVYCEKPLTHSIFEARAMATGAKEHGLATQMGNGGHAKEGARLTNEWIQAGVIGEVREVHVWTDRAGNYWPQGVGRPAETPPSPPGLDWDLWLGPAPNRPYHPMYHPQKWRGWWDFGTGALGDMGCHIIDHPVWALELGHPKSVEARATLAGLNTETFPVAAVIYYEFPARGKLPPVTMTWYEGGLLPPTPPVMSAGESLPGNGALYIGSRGVMYHGSGGDMPRLAPVELAEEARQVPKTMPRSVGHHLEWIEACKGGKPAMSNFGYSGPLTEIVLLGNLALRVPGRRIEWDGEKMKALNAPELDQHIRRDYRAGWTL